MVQQKRVGLAIRIDQPYPHHQEVFLGIQRYAREHRHWQIVIDEHPYWAVKRRKSSAQYDGVIARASVTLQNRLRRLGTPLVNVVFQYHRAGIAGVFSDPNRMGQLAAEHIIDRGFRRLVGMFDQLSRHTSVMAEAFAVRAEQAGVECRMLKLVERPYDDARGWSKIEKQILAVLSSVTPPVGIFVANAETARLLVQHAIANGVHVPQELAVMCQHNIDSIVSVPPQISSIDSNYERVGYEAAALLDRLMNGAPVPDQPVLVSPRGVVGRETTDYFAVEDQLVGEALRYISSQLHEKLRVDDIAYALNVSTRLLQIRFSKALGVGVSEEIRRLRLEKAKRLLIERNRSISSIPDEVGFGTLYVMNQVFHRELGMSPSAYRKKLLGERWK